MEMETFKYIVSLSDTKQLYPTSSWVRISTITMNAAYPNPVDIEKFKAEFKPMMGWSISEKPDKKFYNCVTVISKDQYTNKNVKIFPNGTIQATGCCDLADTVRVSKRISAVINAVTGQNAEIPVDSIKTRLINTNFSVNHVLNLHTLYREFKRDPVFTVEFNSERYSALKVKFTPVEGDKKVTVSIFSTGKVVMMTGGSLKLIAAAYRTVNEKMEDFGAKVEQTPEQEQEQYPVFMGYEFSQWVPMLKRRGIKSF
jgi:TATA-box binding protein (TBP) (component of TFIID and TFIIIB)